MFNIFRYTPKDSLLVLFAIAVLLTPLLIINANLSIIGLAIVSFFHIWLIVICQNSSLHHHTHCPIFKSKKLNRVYELLVSAATGIPHHSWKSGHLIHHVHVNDKPVNGKTKDPTSVYAAGKDGNPTNFWIYCFGPLLWLNIKFYLFMRAPTVHKIKVYRNEYKHEQWAFYVFITSIMCVDFFYGLLLLVLYILSYAVNNANSYGEHWGALTRRGDTTQDSVGIYSKWYNLITFNAGYHQEHHHKPGTHWSRLPEVTPLLHPDRVIVNHGIHITNNPFQSHFVALIKGENVEPK